MQTTLMPKRSRSVETKTSDPDNLLSEALSFAYAAAIEIVHSTQAGIDRDEVFLNDLEPYMFLASNEFNNILMQLWALDCDSLFLAAQAPN